MFDHLPCPACRALLVVRPELAGRTVRCPSCQIVFGLPLPVDDIPLLQPANEPPAVVVPAWYPPAESEPLPEVIPLEEPKPVAGAFDWTTCQDVSVNVLRSGNWRTARDGLSLVFGVNAFSLALGVGATGLLAWAWGGVEFLGLLFFMQLGLFVAFVLMTIGQFMCARVPDDTDGAACAQVAAWMNLSYLGYQFAATLVTILIGPARGAGGGQPAAEVEMLPLLLTTTWLSVATVAWFLFLHQVAAFLGDRPVARRAQVLIVLFAGYVVAAGAAFFVAAGQEFAVSPDVLRVSLGLFVVAGLGLSVFHLIVVRGVARVIDEAQRAARLQPKRWWERR